MKKIFMLSLSFGLIAFGFSNCKKDKKEDCQAAMTKYSAAFNAYMADDNSDNCNAFKVAVNEYLSSSCFAGLSAEQKASVEEFKNWPCD